MFFNNKQKKTFKKNNNFNIIKTIKPFYLK
ncbi:MAG: hypothetical protein ACI9XO_004838 [Paraglaciecola sp.]|jgi:hypothetical protein